jgi:hypothetical protein
MSEPIAAITIALMDDGGLVVERKTTDKLQAIGMLEMAKAMVFNEQPKAKPNIVIPNGVTIPFKAS